MQTKIQYRAVCPACFKQHAVKGVALVDHGYTIPQDWHQRNGSCGGACEPHFGTPEGLAVTERIKVSYERFLAGQVALLAKIPAATSVKGPKSAAYKAPIETLTPADGHWFQRAIVQATYQIEATIRGVTSDIEHLGKRIAAWAPAEPVEVEVKSGQTIHLSYAKFPSKVRCTYRDARGYVHRAVSDDLTQVTCTRCLKAAKAAA